MQNPLSFLNFCDLTKCVVFVTRNLNDALFYAKIYGLKHHRAVGLYATVVEEKTRLLGLSLDQTYHQDKERYLGEKKSRG